MDPWNFDKQTETMLCVIVGDRGDVCPWKTEGTSPTLENWGEYLLKSERMYPLGKKEKISSQISSLYLIQVGGI